MEAEQEVKTIQVTLNCPDCEQEMHYVTKTTRWFGGNSIHVYKCNRCNGGHESTTVYPYTKYVPINKVLERSNAIAGYGYYANN